MRIVGGRWRGRRLLAPPGQKTRPTADRTREALFNVLAHAPWAEPHRVDGKLVLDAFAGTGAIGLEALSRGAARAVFMDTGRDALAALRRNVAACDANGTADILAADATDPPPAADAVGLALLDPPYGRDVATVAITALQRAGWIDRATLIVLETRHAAPLPLATTLLDERRYGIASLRFLRLSAS